jgi:hypothetical protein
MIIGTAGVDKSRAVLVGARRLAGFERSRYTRVPMAWIKVPPENHPVFRAALPDDPRVETLQMFGGVAAKVNGHLFAGLFARSTMVFLNESDRAAALALDGAALFDPMGDGRMRSDKVMLPEAMMGKPAELRRWIKRAFEAASLLPPKKATGKAPTRESAKKPAATAKKPAPAGEKKRPRKK